MELYSATFRHRKGNLLLKLVANIYVSIQKSPNKIKRVRKRAIKKQVNLVFLKKVIL